MTVSTTTSRVTYAGNGSTKTFAVNFYFLADADLVLIKVSSSGVQTTLVLNTDYTATGAGVSAGGSVTLTTAPATGETLVIYRDPAATQTVDYQANDPFPAETHERALDKLTMIAQRVKDLVSRTLRISDGDTGSATLTVPLANARANKALIFDASGNVTVSVDNYNDQAANAAASASSAASSASSALSYLNQFKGQYYGSAAADPATDPLGNPPTSGDLYFNTATNKLRVYSGAQWVEGSSGSVSVQAFSGTGSQTAFTLATAPQSENNTQVYISGVYQQKSVYDISGTTLTFTTAPPSGSNNIEVVTFNTLPLGNTDASLVAFTPSGAGAAQRTALDKMREWVSITDFGASTSASAAVNTAAINAALAASKSVMVPEGTFNFTGFTIPSGRTLFGASRDGSILQSTDSTAVAVINVSGVVVENLTIISTGTAYGNTVYVGNGANQVTVQNCVIVSAYRPFMAGDPGDAAGCTYVRFLYNRTYTSSVDGGIRTRKGANGTGGVMWFVGNIIVNNNATSEDVGIETWTPDTTIVDNVIVANNLKGGFSGITFGVGEGGIAKGNRITGFSAGIEIGGSGKGLHIIDGNQISNCKEGILVSSGGVEEAVTITNNVIVMDAANRSDYLYAFYIQCKAAIVANNTAYFHRAGTTYLNSNSRAATAVYGDTNNKQMLVENNVFKNFSIGVQLAATSPDVQIVGNDFYNVYNPVYDSGGTPQTFFANNNVSEFAFFNVNGYCNLTSNEIRRSANYPVGANANLSTTPYVQSLSTAYIINENNRFVNVGPSAFGFNAEYYVTASARPAVERVNGTYRVANLSDPAAAKTAVTNVSVNPNGKFIEEWFTGNIYAIGQNGAVTSYGTAAPTSGTWARGDIVKHSTPAVGSPKGWVCTVAGTPGTWVSEGNL